MLERDRESEGLREKERRRGEARLGDIAAGKTYLRVHPPEEVKGLGDIICPRLRVAHVVALQRRFARGRVGADVAVARQRDAAQVDGAVVHQVSAVLVRVHRALVILPAPEPDGSAAIQISLVGVGEIVAVGCPSEVALEPIVHVHPRVIVGCKRQDARVPGQSVPYSQKKTKAMLTEYID